MLSDVLKFTLAILGFASFVTLIAVIVEKSKKIPEKEDKAYEIFRTAIILSAFLMASVAIGGLIYGFFTGQLI